MRFEVPRKLLDPTKYSSYWKLIRVTVWILRFQRIVLKRDEISGNLTALDLEEVRSYWNQTLQGECFFKEFKARGGNLPNPEDSKISRYDPFLDEGYIRLCGRLQFAKLSSEQRHPIPLDGQHHFTKSLILQTHIRLCNLDVCIMLVELREEFWNLRARLTNKQVLNSCLTCRIAKGRPGEEI